jgi:hypothetical protein
VSTTALRRTAWAVLGCVVLLVLMVLALSLGTGANVDLFPIAMLAFPVVGALIASRQPHNPIGWVMLAVGVVAGLDALSVFYIDYALSINPGSLPRPDIALALNAPLWVPLIGLMGTFVILLFPDGRLPSPRWRPWARLCAAALVLNFVGIMISPDAFVYPGIRNPLVIDALRPFLDASWPVILLIPIGIVGCAVALIRRFRRSSGQQRLQLKWLAAATGTIATIYLTAMVPSVLLDSPWDGTGSRWLVLLQNVAALSFVLIPVAAGIAILKYRLYDVDLIINRTLVYGALTAVLALVYVGGVVGLGGILRELTGQQDNNLAVAASTLAVAALFRPARGRIQGFIDRRFYRRKYDAAQTLESFSARLRDEVDLDELSADLLTAIKDTMQPAHASLWLRPGAEQ